MSSNCRRLMKVMPKKTMQYSSTIDESFCEVEHGSSPFSWCFKMFWIIWRNLWRESSHENLYKRIGIHKRFSMGYNTQQNLPCSTKKYSYSTSYDKQQFLKTGNYFSWRNLINLFLNCHFTKWCYCRGTKLKTVVVNKANPIFSFRYLSRHCTGWPKYLCCAI